MSEFDHDAIMAYEAGQQEAIKQGINALHQVTGEGYRTQFLRVGRMGLLRLHGKDCILDLEHSDFKKEWAALVSPIALFTENEVERKYLVSRALLEILTTGLDLFRTEYARSDRFREIRESP